MPFYRKNASWPLVEFDTEVYKIKDSLRILESELFKLESDKQEIETLIVEGNPALASKLIPLNKGVSEKNKEIEELKSTINSIFELKDQQKIKLEHDIYNKFLNSNELQKEFKDNAEKLQLQLSSLLYKAFETTETLKELEDTYKNSVDREFSFTPYGSFVETFPSTSVKLYSLFSVLSITL